MASAINQLPREFKKVISKTVQAKYLLFLPAKYEKTKKKWPLILFLHGAGERGDDLEKVKRHGPPKIVAARPDFPFLVVSPQCPEGLFWDTDTLMALLDEIAAHYRVDEKRIYLTGLSMGGFGTWEIATAHPERFAAIAPICGGGTPRKTRRMIDLPAWVFHGAKDPVVPVEDSQAMVDALKKFGGDVRFTVYPEAKHDSWTETYNNQELYEWFLSHHRKIDKKRLTG